MKKIMCNVSPLSMVVLLALAAGFSSCKSQKKMTQAPTVEAIEEAEEDVMIEEQEEEVAPVERNTTTNLSKEQKLTNYFGAIASASSTDSANASIQEALALFSAPNAPVLIVIYKDGAQVGYDEPTTIEKYLNYLKDTKNNNTQVEEVVYDDNGNIKELVLKK